MQFSQAFALVMVLLPTVAAKHRVKYDGSELAHNSKAQGSTYDFTVCDGPCQSSRCKGDTIRFTGDRVGDTVQMPGTECIIVHAGPPNNIQACFHQTSPGVQCHVNGCADLFQPTWPASCQEGANGEKSCVIQEIQEIGYIEVHLDNITVGLFPPGSYTEGLPCSLHG